MPNSPHILVTDDDGQIRTSLARFLSASGFRVSVAPDGVAMFAAVANRRFDLIVLDIMMPGEDGLSICPRFRAMSKIPVVLLSAMSGEADRVVGLELEPTMTSASPLVRGNSWRASARCCGAPRMRRARGNK